MKEKNVSLFEVLRLTSYDVIIDLSIHNISYYYTGNVKDFQLLEVRDNKQVLKSCYIYGIDLKDNKLIIKSTWIQKEKESER